MQIRELTITNTSDTAAMRLWQEIMGIYRVSFPDNERRCEDNMLSKVIDEPHFHLYIVQQDANITDSALEPSTGELVAFMTIWNFGEWIYGEYLAVKPTLRGANIGTKLLNYVYEHWQRPLILEIERLDEEGLSSEEMLQRQSRLRFYTRLGFAACTLPYMQPQYSPTQARVPLMLMERGGNILPDGFERVKTTLYHDVYGWYES